MNLRELLKGLEIKEIRGSVDVEISGIAYDSRSVQKGFIFGKLSTFSIDT